MSYHGHIPFLKQFLSSRNEPRILEIGIDRGVTLFPIVTFLARQKNEWSYYGIDVDVQEQAWLTIAYMDQPIPQKTLLIQENSLQALPKFVHENRKFDLILLDGDHNYHTVSRELDDIVHVLHDDGLLVIDDYDGKWSERDLWYHDRPGYEANLLVTKPFKTNKVGVKPAVDEWLLSHSEFNKYKIMNGEPVVVTKLKLQ